jgi:hypothetical protein
VPDHATLRRRAAEYVRLHAASFAPFLPYEPGDGYPEGVAPDAAAVSRAVERYTARMATSSAWGGHPELRALVCTLGLPATVYQAGAPSYSITPDVESVAGGAPAAAASGTPAVGGGGARRGRGRGRAGSDDDDGDVGGAGGSDRGGRGRDVALMGDPSLALRLSFHRTYYASGEHYNSVVPVSPAGAQ